MVGERGWNIGPRSQLTQSSPTAENNRDARPSQRDFAQQRSGCSVQRMVGRRGRTFRAQQQRIIGGLVERFSVQTHWSEYNANRAANGCKQQTNALPPRE